MSYKIIKINSKKVSNYLSTKSKKENKNKKSDSKPDAIISIQVFLFFEYQRSIEKCPREIL
jgi:hypothetical protein